jgi:hypothetical protein
VHVGRHRVDLAVDGEVVQQALRERLVQPEVLVELTDVVDLAVLDVVTELGTGVRLERARRLARGQVVRQHLLGVRSRATGDGRVLERVVLALVLEDRDHAVEAGLLAAVRPPGEDGDGLVARGAAAAVTVVVAVPASADRQ